MKKRCLFLVLSVLSILNLGAQEPAQQMPVEPAEAITIAPAEHAPKEEVVLDHTTSPQKEESLTSEKGMRMDLVKVGMSQDAHKTSIEMLKKLQADEFVLYLKTWNFHWNVTGMNFNDLHGLFLKQYEQLQGFVDDVAERIRALGGIAPGTQAEFLKLSRLKEEAGVIPPAKEMIKKLLEDHEAIIQSLREDVETSAKINDAGTNNFLSDLIMKHEKTAWMLRAYLEA